MNSIILVPLRFHLLGLLGWHSMFNINDNIANITDYTDRHLSSVSKLYFVLCFPNPILIFYCWCGSRYFNQWIWAKNLKSVKTFRKSLVTYMKRFEDNNHVFSVRFCLPEAIFWLRGEMMGQKWVKSEIHHFSFFGYNSPIKCAIWVHNTILETSGHLLFSSKPENGQKWPKISTWRPFSRIPENWPSLENPKNPHVYCFFWGFFTLNPFKIN